MTRTSKQRRRHPTHAASNATAGDLTHRLKKAPAKPKSADLPQAARS